MQEQPESAPLLGEASGTTTPQSRAKTVVLLALGGAALFGLGRVSSPTRARAAALAIDKADFAPVPSTAGSGLMSGLMATNDNIAHQGPLGQDYPWMDGLLVEPHYETTFVAGDADANDGAQTWTVTNLDSGEVVAQEKASHFVHTFTALGKYSVSAADAEGIVHVKYVRHEIRSLTDVARDRLFKAWAEVIKYKDEVAARAQFGEDFTTLRKLNALHNNWAGAADCDHLHDGMGFITTHVQMNQVFEASLQAVDPSVTLPYWEYTVDVEHIISDKAANFQHWKDLEVWTDKYFGQVDFSTAQMETGIFRDIDMSADDTYSTVVNAYGLIRSPWNTLGTNRPVRYQGAGGASRSEVSGEVAPEWSYMPTCANLMTVTNTSKDFYTFSWDVSQQAHGPVHLLTGGMAGTEDLLGLSERLGVDVTAGGPSHGMVWKEVSEFFMMVARAAYRFNLMTVPVPNSCTMDPETGEGVSSEKEGSCSFTCDAKGIMASPIYEKMFELYSFTSNFDDAQLLELVSYLCEGNMVFGDHGTSSAAADPSFFPMHGAIERYLDLMRIKGRIVVEAGSSAWPERDHCLFATNMHPFTAECAGHYADDELLFGEVAGKGVMTNLEYFKYLDPTVGERPYVYDDFKWPHCEAAGFKIQ